MYKMRGGGGLLSGDFGESIKAIAAANRARQCSQFVGVEVLRASFATKQKVFFTIVRPGLSESCHLAFNAVLCPSRCKVPIQCFEIGKVKTNNQQEVAMGFFSGFFKSSSSGGSCKSYSTSSGVKISQCKSGSKTFTRTTSTKKGTRTTSYKYGKK